MSILQGPHHPSVYQYRTCRTSSAGERRCFAPSTGAGLETDPCFDACGLLVAEQRPSRVESILTRLHARYPCWCSAGRDQSTPRWWGWSCTDPCHCWAEDRRNQSPWAIAGFQIQELMAYQARQEVVCRRLKDPEKPVDESCTRWQRETRVCRSG